MKSEKPEKLPTTMTGVSLPKWIQSCRAAPAKWRRRSRPERRLLLEAFALLGVARLLVISIPFRWFAFSLGRHMNESCLRIDPSDLPVARMVGWAVCSAVRNIPWQSVCLPQAVAAQWMLKRRRIPGTLYLGVAKDETREEEFAAHAWLRCGDAILTGAAGHERFTVVATFATDFS
jgi:hypothetical protein